MSSVQRITITPDDADQRLDRWLKRQFPQLSQIRIEKMCRKGELRVDGARCKASTRLETGQEIRIPPSASATVAVSQKRLIFHSAIFYPIMRLIAAYNASVSETTAAACCKCWPG
jgi:23S rRNA-/tRNA-specific pseudouridylate synthase